MSVLHTESFIAFGRATLDDSYNTAQNAQRTAFEAALERAGYDVLTGLQTAASNAAGFVIRPDPVAPDRNALVLSIPGPAMNGNGMAAVRRQLPPTNKTIIMGISVYVPADFVGGTTTSLLRFMGTNITDTAWTTKTDTPSVGAEKELFRIRGDLTFGYANEAAVSTKKLGVGRLNYIEIRISDSETRVWLDDTLVVQKTGGRSSNTIGFTFDHGSTAGGLYTGVGSQWAFSNWYILADDGIAPSQRLGPTTRITGVRPTSDVKAEFVRPVGPTSNAAVVAQDLVDAPPLSLQSTTVGNEDIYAVASDSAVSGATMIHAVVTKALAANLESAPHSLLPFVESDGVRGVDKRGVNLEQVPAPTTRNYLGVARRPTDNKLFIVGQGFSVLRESADSAGTGRGFDLLFDDGTTGYNNCISFRADGLGIIGRSDGKITIIDPTTDALTTYSVGTSAFNGVVQFIRFMPNGNVIMFGASGAIRVSPGTPQTQASWVTKSAGSTTWSAVAYNSNSNVISVFTNTTSANLHWQSSDQGNTWAQFSTPNSQIVGAVFDGEYTYAFNNITASATLHTIYRSVDGKTSFVQIPAVTANGISGSGFAPTTVSYNPQSEEFFLAGSSGRWATSLNGVDYKQQPSLPNTLTVNDAAVANDGSFIAVQNTGNIWRYGTPKAEVPLTPLGGYQMTYSSSAFDPATATNWQPGKAATSNFGMKLTS